MRLYVFKVIINEDLNKMAEKYKPNQDDIRYMVGLVVMSRAGLDKVLTGNELYYLSAYRTMLIDIALSDGLDKAVKHVVNAVKKIREAPEEEDSSSDTSSSSESEKPTVYM